MTRARGPRPGIHGAGHIVCGDTARASQYEQLFRAVSKLAYVSRPGHFHQPRERFTRQLGTRAVVFFLQIAPESLYQQRDILGAFAQSRNVKSCSCKSEIEVLPELAVLDLRL